MQIKSSHASSKKKKRSLLVVTMLSLSRHHHHASLQGKRCVFTHQMTLRVCHQLADLLLPQWQCRAAAAKAVAGESSSGLVAFTHSRTTLALHSSSASSKRQVYIFKSAGLLHILLWNFFVLVHRVSEPFEIKLAQDFFLTRWTHLQTQTMRS